MARMGRPIGGFYRIFDGEDGGGWGRQEDGYAKRVGRCTVRLEPESDGRWSWEVVCSPPEVSTGGPADSMVEAAKGAVHTARHAAEIDWDGILDEQREP